MKNKLQNIIKHIKTMFYNLVSGKFSKSQVDTISTNEKKCIFGKWLKNIFMGDKIEDNEIKPFEEKYITAIDNLYSKDFSIWRTRDELIDLTGTTITQLTNIIENSDSFLTNRKGYITTKKKYKRKEKFLKQVNDTLNGYIG